ncbi:MAG TPA: hypothetical protein VIJ01_12365, partial [Candidatus Angelobacter sp.]
EKLTEQQLILALLNVTQKEAQLLAIQTMEIVQLVQESKFSRALTLHEPLVERVRIPEGMLVRAANTVGRVN